MLPSVSLDSPASGEVYHVSFDDIPIRAEALQQPGGFPIRRVSVALNGEVMFVSDETSSYVASIEVDYPVPNPTFTTYSIIAYAEDWAGNVVESDEVQVTTRERTFNTPEFPPPCAIGGDQRLSTIAGPR